MFRLYAKIRVFPTKKGLTELDDSHPVFPRRYLVGKPLRELEQHEFLEYHAAREDGLLEVEIYVDKRGEEPNLFDDSFRTGDVFGVKSETSQAALEWIRLREESLEMCVLELLCPYFAKETYEVLLDEARKCVQRVSGFRSLPVRFVVFNIPSLNFSDSCDFNIFKFVNNFSSYLVPVFQKCRDLFERRISVGKYQPTTQYNNEDDEPEDNQSAAVRIIAVAMSSDGPGEARAVALDPNGLVEDSCPVLFRNKFDRGQEPKPQGVSWSSSVEHNGAGIEQNPPLTSSDLR